MRKQLRVATFMMLIAVIVVAILIALDPKRPTHLEPEANNEQTKVTDEQEIQLNVSEPEMFVEASNRPAADCQPSGNRVCYAAALLP